MEKKLFIRKFRVFLDKNISKIVIYAAFMKVVLGVLLILKFNLKTRPFFALLGILIVLLGPFIIGILASILHKIVIKLDENSNIKTT